MDKNKALLPIEMRHYRPLTSTRHYHLSTNMRHHRLSIKIRCHRLSMGRFASTTDLLLYSRFLMTVQLKKIVTKPSLALMQSQKRNQDYWRRHKAQRPCLIITKMASIENLSLQILAHNSKQLQKSAVHLECASPCASSVMHAELVALGACCSARAELTAGAALCVRGNGRMRNCLHVNTKVCLRRHVVLPPSMQIYLCMGGEPIVHAGHAHSTSLVHPSASLYRFSLLLFRWTRRAHDSELLPICAH